ncbi:spermatogenesis-associated protein 31A5-like [Vicugna pacos]|uniref:Spermatogenesis-associated protein 31A5-like n=1 Tax=Vicugna pacos TaxID=30538 RepID=A0ABM5BZZ0_VICPA
MENYLFSLKSTLDTFLSSSCTFRVPDLILGILCGLGLFFLIISCFQDGPPAPPPRKHGSFSKHPPKGRGRSRKRNGALEAYRVCQEKLEEVQNLVLLLQSHLGRFLDKGGFQHLYCQEPPDKVCTAEPAGAQQPCREEGISTMFPAPLTKHLPPLASAPLPDSVIVPVSIHLDLPSSACPSPEPFLCLDSLSSRPLALSPLPPSPPDARACSTPLTAPSAPLLPDSTPRPQRDPLALPRGTTPRSSSPRITWAPGISGLDGSSCPVPELPWCQVASKAWRVFTVTRSESQQGLLSRHPPEAPFWEDPTGRQVKASGLPFVTPDVQKLLEVLITKRAGLKIQKEKGKEQGPGYHLDSSANTFKSLDPRHRQHFWSIKGQPAELLGPEKAAYLRTRGAQLQQTCSQLFWGLPFLHSESLVAPVIVADSSPKLPSVIFNEPSNAKPLQNQAKVTSLLSLAQPLPSPPAQAQPQPLTPTRPQSQPPPLAQAETQARPHLLTPTRPDFQPPPLARFEMAHCIPSFPTLPPSSQPQGRYCDVACPAVPNKAQPFTSTAVQNLESHFLKKQLEREKNLPSVVRKSQQVSSQAPLRLPQGSRASQAHSASSVPPRNFISPGVREKLEQHLQQRFTPQQSTPPFRSQVSQKLVEPQGTFPGPCQAQGTMGPSKPSAFIGQGSCDAQKMGSSYPTRAPPGKGLYNDVGHSVGRILKDIYVTSASHSPKAPSMKTELKSHLSMKTESNRDLSLGRKHPENVLGVLLGRMAEQTHEGPIRMNVHCSRPVANPVLDLPEESNSHKGAGSPEPPQDWEPCMNTSRESLVPSPCIQQVLEAHIIRFRRKHSWSLLRKALKFLSLFKLKKAHPMAVPSSTVEVTCESGDLSKPQPTEVLEKPPQPQLEENVRTTESASTLLSPLLAPSCPCEKLPGDLGGSPPGNVHEPPEASLIGQGDKSPSQPVTYKFIGRIWHNESVMGAEKGSLQQPSPSPSVARDKPREETGGRASSDSCSSVTAVDLNAWPRSSKAQDTDPAWKSILDPGMMIRSQTMNVDQKGSWSPRSIKSLSSSAQSVELTPEDVYSDAQLRKLEGQRFAKPEQQRMRVLLQDCETGVLLQDCATSTLLQDCHSDMYLAADILAAEASLSHSQSLSSGDMSVSQALYDLSSSGGSSWGPQEPWGQQAPSKSQRKKSGPTDARENARRPRPGQHKKGLAERKARQARGLSRPSRKKEPADSQRSEARQLTLRKGRAQLESSFRKYMKLFLQWVSPSKDRGPKNPLQKGKPASATARSPDPAQSRPFTDSTVAEAEALITAVGQILEEKLALHPGHGPYASELNWHEGDPQAPAGQRYCYHRVVSYQEHRRVMREKPCDPRATRKGHSCHGRSRRASPSHRDGKWAFPPEEPGPPGRRGQHGPGAAGIPGHPAHCPRHCLLRNCASPAPSRYTPYVLPRRATLLPGTTYTMQRAFFSQVSTSPLC